jgi:hypothetical protein
MLQYFCDFIDDAKDLVATLSPYYHKYLDKLGITEEYIRKGVTEIIKNA